MCEIRDYDVLLERHGPDVAPLVHSQGRGHWESGLNAPALMMSTDSWLIPSIARSAGFIGENKLFYSGSIFIIRNFADDMIWSPHGRQHQSRSTLKCVQDKTTKTWVLALPGELLLSPLAMQEIRQQRIQAARCWLRPRHPEYHRCDHYVRKKHAGLRVGETPSSFSRTELQPTCRSQETFRHK